MSVAPLLLCGVERAVGPLVGGLVVLAREQGAADADREVDGKARLAAEPPRVRVDGARDGLRVVQRARLEVGDELVAAEPPDKAAPRERLPQRVRHADERAVAALVPERVVDALEMVDVEQKEHAAARAVRARPPDVLAHPAARRAGVVDAREPVELGARDEPRLLVRLLRDIAEDAEQVVGAPLLVLQHEALHEEAARRLAAAQVLIGRLGGKGAEAVIDGVERMGRVRLRRLPAAREIRQLLGQVEEARAVGRERRDIPSHLVADRQQAQSRRGAVEELRESPQPTHLPPQAMDIEKEAGEKTRQNEIKNFLHRLKASFVLFRICLIPIIQKKAANGKSPFAASFFQL